MTTNAVKYSMGLELESSSKRRRGDKSATRSTRSEAGRLRNYESDLKKISELWKQTRAELQVRNKEVEELRRKAARADSHARKARDHESELAKIQSDFQEAQDRLHFAESQLATARVANDKYATRFEELQARNRELEQEVWSAKDSSEARNVQLRKLERRIRDLEAEKESIVRNTVQEVRNYDEELNQTEEELRRAKKILLDRDQESRRLREETTQQQLQLVKLEEAARKNLRNAERATGTLDKMRQELQSHRSVVLGEQQLRIENEHLKIDNARIVRLLGSTKEYKQFLTYWEDGGGVTYLPASTSGGKGKGKKGKGKGGKGKSSIASSLGRLSGLDANLDALGAVNDPALMKSLVGPSGAWGDVRVFQKVYNRNDAGVSNPIDGKGFNAEKEHWIPTDALRLSVDFKLRHLPHVSMELISEYLRQLNEIWRLREQRHIARLKKKLQKQIQSVKRDALNKVPYAEVIQRNKISALQKELKELRAVVAHGGRSSGLDDFLASGASKKKKKKNEIGEIESSKLLEASLATVENLSRQVQELHEQNVSLKTELEHASSATLSAGDKTFMDGAAWFGRSSVMVADKMGEKVEDALKALQEVAERVGGSDDDDDEDEDGDAARAIKAQVLDTVAEVEECVTEGRVRIRKLFEGMLDASKDFGGAAGGTGARPGSASSSDAFYGDSSDADTDVGGTSTKPRPSSSVASALGLAYKSAAKTASKFGGKAEYTSDSSFFE